jgi:hypothetical protein
MAMRGRIGRGPRPHVVASEAIPPTPPVAGPPEKERPSERDLKEAGEPMMRIILATVVMIALLAGPAVAGASVTLYATDVVNRNLYRIDTDTWEVELVGFHGVPSGFCGLAYDQNGGRLLGITRYTTARLYSIDIDTASATVIGSLNVGYVFEGGLVFDNERGLLYGANAISNMDPHIFTVDSATGAGSIVGRVGAEPHDFAGLVVGQDGVLYGLDRETNAVWRIDVGDTEGPGTEQIGTGLGAGVELGPVGGFTADGSGNVYGYASDSHQIFSVDMETGAATVLHTFDSSVPVFYAIASGGSAPSAVEETSWTSIKAMFAR